MEKGVALALVFGELALFCVGYSVERVACSARGALAGWRVWLAWGGGGVRLGLIGFVFGSRGGAE